MLRRLAVVANSALAAGALVIGVIGLAACGSTKHGDSLPPTSVTDAPSTSTAPAPTTTPPVATTPPQATSTLQVTPSTTASSASTVSAESLPIAVSDALSSSGQDPSILLPSSCRTQGGVVRAKGTFEGGFAPEGYTRSGDVVELYAYAAPASGQSLQVGDLGSERPFAVAGRGPWMVTVPVDAQIGLPVRCLVAVQSTHAFMGAGNAGG